MTNSERLHNILSNFYTGIDSASWLLDPENRQTAFLANLKSAQEETNAVVWTTSHCVEELRQKLDDPDLHDAAARALDFIEAGTADGSIMVYEYGQIASDRKAFADPTFLSALLNHRAETNLALITQDGDLAANAARLNAFESIQGGRIFIYRINGGGWPVRFNLFETADGMRVSPKRSGLHCRWDTPATEIDDTPRSVTMLRPRDTLWGSRGAAYVLEEKLASGEASDIYTVRNMPELVIKAFHGPSERKEAKCGLLASSGFSAKHSVTPLDLLYDQEGNFRGYTMRRIHGCTLEQLLSPAGRTQNAPDWNRLDFARLAAQIVSVTANLAVGDLRLLDVHPSNILVGYDLQSGKLDANAVWMLDLDSAQFGSEATGVFPSDEVDACYAAPEYLRDGTHQAFWTDYTLVYSLAVVVFRCVMAGFHPFRMEDEAAPSISQAIQEGMFPYGAGARLHGAAAPMGAGALWSNLSSSLKRCFSQIFQAGGEQSILERPSLFMLLKELLNYVNWLKDRGVQMRYPEILSLAPRRNKPFYATCANRQCKDKTKEFVVDHYRSDGLYYCPQCREEALRRRNAFRETAAEVISFPTPEPVSPVREQEPVRRKSLADRAKEFCVRLFA